jgi:putative CocE/NonD family hydrolase
VPLGVSSSPRLTTTLLCTLLASALMMSACTEQNNKANSTQNNGTGSGSTVQTSQANSGGFSTLGTRTANAKQVALSPENAHQWTNYDRPADFPGMVELPSQFIKMKDGTELAVSITLPATANGQAASGKFPAVLIQTAYNKSTGRYASGIGGADPYMVQRGYATVVVDVRGTGNSQGVWDAFGEKEQADYVEVLDWLIQQNWSDGKVGLYGVSYLGITAILTAAQNHPAVKAAFPIVPIGDGFRDIVFTGGQVNPTFIPIWMGLVTSLSALPFDAFQQNPMRGAELLVSHLLNSVTAFQAPTIVKTVVGDSNTAFDGDFWKTRSPLEKASNIKVPTFIVGGLHDLFQRSEPMWFEALKQQTTTKLLIGPWTHIEAAGIPSNGLPKDGVPKMNQIQLMWFDQYVKGMDVKADQVPNVTQFVKGLNKYATTSNWPHPRMQAQAMYLRGDKTLKPQVPTAPETASTILQVPVFGICSLSTSQWTAGIANLLPLPCFTEDTIDQIPAANFRTPVLTEDMYINGPIAAEIWIKTTAMDASLSVRISDYDPASGRSVALSNGLLTASHRKVDDSKSRFVNGLRIQPWHTFTSKDVQTVKSNDPMLLPVEIFPTSAVIAKGHQLQISITTSNLPQGLPPAMTLVRGAVGAVTVLNEPKYPSRVILPLVPRNSIR